MARYSPVSPTILLPSNLKIEQVNETIERLSKHLEAVSESDKPFLQSKLLTAKLMKERLVAMTALAKAQLILAEMDVVTAENNLNLAVQELEHFELGTEQKLPEAAACASLKAIQKEIPKLIMPEKEPSPKMSKSKPATVNKENVISSNKSVPSASRDKGKKSRSHTPPTSVRKRKHSQNSKHHDKRSKKSRTSSKQTESISKNTKLTSKCTVSPTSVATVSPISIKSSPIITPKTSIYMTQGVQTCNLWFQKDKTKQLNNVSSRVLDDDEQTVILETIDMPASHKDTVNLTKTVSKVMSSPPSNIYCRQFPISSQLQLMFEDDLPVDNKNTKSKIKKEAPEMDMNTSTDTLVNGLFEDIMKSKMQKSNQMINCSKVLPESDYFCKVTLRQMLEQC